MLRLSLLTALLCAPLLACGTPCSRIAGAEANAAAKGKDCGASDGSWTGDKLAKCEQNLGKCSPDDVKWLDTYADCLNKLPPCASGQGFSWGLQRFGCAESLFKVSGACGAGL